ncbi:GNAT family N-acetyltransferase [Pedobacter mendelii]|uniref:N-acetyltransferase domain-containing protein n=1 Tax=Pedobacter mendelii TaxID=1908240 RepID=A0ABQ2BG42_9SPHI|nr:GNAT family N-acetyltransferase [Pedobacter mendelii]GGI23321.1 hypothetical protein GCM10008119_07060 [Pedobacter mendelii]
MKKALITDKNLVTDILSKSFDANQSVNYIVKQDQKREQRLKALMDYSFDVCYLFGDVYLSDNNHACALILYPDKKKTTLKSIILDIQLMLNSIGITNINKALDRESKIKKTQSKDQMYYLWFIGVAPEYQGLGFGSDLMNELIEDSRTQERNIYLETSTLKNLPWYKTLGFKIYNELELSYQLYFLKLELTEK